MANTSLLKLEEDSRIDSHIAAVSKRLGMPRRAFLQFCATLATSLGLPPGADAAVAEAGARDRKSGV